jgi:hypothetical protein
MPGAGSGGGCVACHGGLDGLGSARHGPGPAPHPSASGRAAAELAGGAGQGVPLGLVVQVGYAGLSQVVADGVHRGLLGVAWWALLSSRQLVDTSLPVTGFARQ